MKYFWLVFFIALFVASLVMAIKTAHDGWVSAAGGWFCVSVAEYARCH